MARDTTQDSEPREVDVRALERSLRSLRFAWARQQRLAPRLGTGSQQVKAASGSDTQSGSGPPPGGPGPRGRPYDLAVLMETGDGCHFGIGGYDLFIGPGETIESEAGSENYEGSLGGTLEVPAGGGEIVMNVDVVSPDTEVTVTLSAGGKEQRTLQLAQGFHASRFKSAEGLIAIKLENSGQAGAELHFIAIEAPAESPCCDCP